MSNQEGLLARFVVHSLCLHFVLCLQLQQGLALDQEGPQLWGPPASGPQQALEAAHE